MTARDAYLSVPGIPYVVRYTVTDPTSLIRWRALQVWKRHVEREVRRLAREARRRREQEESARMMRMLGGLP